jgi:hypothetical protein
MGARYPVRPAVPSPGATAFVMALLLAAVVLPASAQPAGKPVPRVAPAEEGVRWNDLTTDQRAALKPLEREWPEIGGSAKQKWLDVAARLPGMPPAERQRVQTRMAEWSSLSPAERGLARRNFQEATQVSPQDRQSRWEAYKALPAEQRQQLAARAAAPATGAKPVPSAPTATAQPVPPRRDAATGRDAGPAKSNIVPNPAFAAQPRPVAPTVVQASPGATTSLMSQRPVPPAHNQTGLPKIAATPGFVDQATLLPKRGPQAAAVRSAAASDAGATPRR